MLCLKKNCLSYSAFPEANGIFHVQSGINQEDGRTIIWKPIQNGEIKSGQKEKEFQKDRRAFKMTAEQKPVHQAELFQTGQKTTEKKDGEEIDRLTDLTA